MMSNKRKHKKELQKRIMKGSVLSGGSSTVLRPYLLSSAVTTYIDSLHITISRLCAGRRDSFPVYNPVLFLRARVPPPGLFVCDVVSSSSRLGCRLCRQKFLQGYTNAADAVASVPRPATLTDLLRYRKFEHFDAARCPRNGPAISFHLSRSVTSRLLVSDFRSATERG